MLDTLVALCVGSALLGVALLGVLSGINAHRRSRIEFRDEVVLMRLRQHLAQLMRDHDSHTLRLPLRLHAGSLRFADGSVNQLTSESSSLSPAADSAAITGLALDLRGAQQVAAGSAGEHYRVCPRFDYPFAWHRYKGFIGITLEGFAELQGQLVHFNSASGCRVFRLRQVRGMISSGQRQRPTLLVPILRCYSIYVDVRGRLRYVSHRGRKNTENQPLDELRDGRGALKRLHLSIEPWGENRLQLLSGLAEFHQGRTRSFNFESRLERSSAFNFLLNNS